MVERSSGCNQRFVYETDATLRLTMNPFTKQVYFTVVRSQFLLSVSLLTQSTPNFFRRIFFNVSTVNTEKQQIISLYFLQMTKRVSALCQQRTIRACSTQHLQRYRQGHFHGVEQFPLWAPFHWCKVFPVN
jgi:hypothetical protein